MNKKMFNRRTFPKEKNITPVNGTESLPTEKSNGKKKKRSKYRPTATWRTFESEIASMFDCDGKRNPLSGASNKDDMGKPRGGDCIIPSFTKHGIKYLIECKLYKSNSVASRALETRKEAIERQIEDYFHFERCNGSKDVYILATSRQWMQKLIDFICETVIMKAEKEKEE
jgi:hypothetical protein